MKYMMNKLNYLYYVNKKLKKNIKNKNYLLTILLIFQKNMIYLIEK